MNTQMSDDKFIYVVTSGSYSSYHIEGVFTASKLAKRFAEAVPNGIVEKYSLDKISSKVAQGYNFYCVDIDFYGDSEEVSICDPCYDDKEREESETSGVDFYNGGGYEFNNRWTFYFWAKSKEGAVKIANEKRIQKIANNEWEPKEEE
jgi:hypothetical protein